MLIKRSGRFLLENRATQAALLMPQRLDWVHPRREVAKHLHGPPKESKFWRRESLKGLQPYIRAVCAVVAAAHDGYSRPGFLPPPCTQGTGNLSECPQPGLTFAPSLCLLQALLQNGVVKSVAVSG